MTRTILFSALLFVTACSQPAPPSVVNYAWARATAPGQSSGAVYALIDNKGGAPDRLVAVSTERAAMAMIHQNEMANGVARCGWLAASTCRRRAGRAQAGRPRPIMLDGLKAPLHAGERFELRLRFEKSGEKAGRSRVFAAGER